MTGRQKAVQLFYPILEKIGSIFNFKRKILASSKKALQSFYDLKATANNGTTYSFGALMGKKVLIVNTASNCGYTPQYDDLEKLYQIKKGELEIIAFPANDFKEQEKGNDDDIASFCKLNFGVSFPLMKKSGVIKSNNQNEVFEWLTNASKNGWNEQAPTWNFCKYLIDEKGNLTHFFEASVSPMAHEIASALK